MGDNSQMLYWNKQIPGLNIDYNEYKPFIKNDWFRSHYMWFAYGLMAIIWAAAFITGGFRAGNLFIRILMFLIVYPVHESLHILTIFRKGDIYLSHSGLYFWLTPDVEMGKGHFWLFMTLPLIVLTGFAGIGSMFATGELKEYLVYIAWINAFIAGSDIINSVLIAIKPPKSVFYRGYFKKANIDKS